MRHDDLSGIPTRLQQMDDAEVQLQVLSPAASPPYADKEVDAVAAARLINDSYAELAAKYPGRFTAVVSLPLPHIDASLREMERGLDQLGMLGVSMTCSCFDRSTAEAEFEPLYEEMNRRGTVLNYHPIQNGICSPMINDYRFTVSVGASLEDSAIVLHLIARRVPERYPSIKYVIPHVGGIIPMLLQRLDNQAPRQYTDLPEPPSVTARRFYYDTVSHGSRPPCCARGTRSAPITSWRGATTRSARSRRTGRRSATSGVEPAGRGRRQDPQPQRPEAPRSGD